MYGVSYREGVCVCVCVYLGNASAIVGVPSEMLVSERAFPVTPSLCQAHTVYTHGVPYRERQHSLARSLAV